MKEQRFYGAALFLSNISILPGIWRRTSVWPRRRLLDSIAQRQREDGNYDDEKCPKKKIGLDIYFFASKCADFFTVLSYANYYCGSNIIYKVGRL